MLASTAALRPQSIGGLQGSIFPTREYLGTYSGGGLERIHVSIVNDPPSIGREVHQWGAPGGSLVSVESAVQLARRRLAAAAMVDLYNTKRARCLNIYFTVHGRRVRNERVWTPEIPSRTFVARHSTDQGDVQL